MPTLLIALASALLLAALVTETAQRFWPDSYIALLAITFVALLINGLFNARLRPTAKPEARPARGDNANRSGTKQRRGNNNRANAKRGGGNKSRNARDNARDKPSRDRTPRDKSAENAPSGPQESGTVKWFNRSKGYGFIIRDNGEEVFVHQRSIVNSGDRTQRPVLRDGQKVSFVVAHLEKGAQAEQVSPLD